jgi:uncharacterized protein (TIGR00266 family)
MNVDIQYRPSYSLATVTLNAGESIQVESGAMVAMAPELQMQTDARGGLMKSLTRSIFGGESFFINTYTAPVDGIRLAIAPTLPGDVAVFELVNKELLVQSGSYLASSSGVNVDTKWTGAKTFFGGEGLIMLKLSGSGTLILSSYGAIHSMTLKTGEKIKVDTGHLVSFDANIQYKIQKVAGWKSTLLSGEGLVIELTGPGEVTLQTRSQDAFLAWLLPKIPRHSSNNG